jgi:hypothetical protein
MNSSELKSTLFVDWLHVHIRCALPYPLRPANFAAP